MEAPRLVGHLLRAFATPGAPVPPIPPAPDAVKRAMARFTRPCQNES